MTATYALGINATALNLVRASSAEVILRRATVTDTFSIVPDFKARLTLTDGVGVMQLLPTSAGSVYEIGFLDGSQKVLSAFFEMPEQDVALHALSISTAWPNVGVPKSLPIDADRLITNVAALGGIDRTQRDKNSDSLHVKDFGAIADGTLHTVSEWHTIGAVHYRGYASFAAVLGDYPFIDSPSVAIDYAAARAAHDYLFANKLKDRCIKLDGCNIWNRELVVLLPISIDGGSRCTPHRAGWNTNRPDGTSIVMVGDGDLCRTLRTRRRYRGAPTDLQDPVLNAAINVQSHGFGLKNITIQNDYDPLLLNSDVGVLVPLVLPTVDSGGNYIAPNYYGAPAIKKRTYRGAGWDCGLFVGARYGKRLDNVGIYCFREYGLYHSSADQGYFISSSTGKRVGCPPFRDWQGRELTHCLDPFNPSSTLGTSVGGDGLDIYGSHFLGNQVGIALHGPLPKAGLLTYGRDYKSRISLMMTRQPAPDENFEVGSYDIDAATPPNRSNYKSVIVRFVTDILDESDGVLQVMIRESVEATLDELLLKMQEAALTPEDEETSSSESGRFDANVYLKESSTTLAIASKYFTTSSSRQFLYGVVVRSATSLFTVTTGTGVTGGGYTEYSPVATADPAPYCWLTGAETTAELAAYTPESGYAVGYVSDSRGQIGMSDISIMNSFLYSLKRTGWDIKQIDTQRRVHDDTDGGASIWIDGLAGNGARRIQKINLTNCRIDSRSAAAGIRLGLSNGIVILNCVPDGYGSGGNVLVPLTNNFYGWLLRNKNTNNSVTTIGQNRADPSTFSYEGPVVCLGNGNARGRSGYFTGRLSARGFIADSSGSYGSHPYSLMRCGVNGMASARLLGKDAQGMTLTYFDSSKNGWLTNSAGGIFLNPAANKTLGIHFAGVESAVFSSASFVPSIAHTYTIGSTTKPLASIYVRDIVTVTSVDDIGLSDHFNAAMSA